MAANTEDDDSETTDTCEQMIESAREVVEAIESAVEKIEAIDTSDLRRRYVKRLEKAKAKLNVAKDSIDELIELAGG